jgi:hypothetical protein
MVGSAADHRGPRGGRPALIGLAGAVLAGVGDVLILGRASSGSEFDRAAGLVPPHVEADDRWRSLWNGAVLPPSRIRAGILTGMAGIAVLEWFGLRAATRAIDRGVERTVATGSAAAFTLSGVITHWSCGAAVLAYQQASQDAAELRGASRISPSFLTRLLGVSAVASLSALAVLSASLAVATLRGRTPTPTWRAAVTPLPCVAATLATFGALPTPVGGYARPASISVGLMIYLGFLATQPTGT